MFIATVVILVALLATIHPFLAVNAPVDGEILVANGPVEIGTSMPLEFLKL